MAILVPPEPTSEQTCSAAVAPCERTHHVALAREKVWVSPAPGGFGSTSRTAGGLQGPTATHLGQTTAASPALLDEMSEF